MKKIARMICAITTLVTIMTVTALPAFAAIVVDVDEGYDITSETTWGDLYRFFDPEEFEALPSEIQMIYDSTIYQDQDYSSTTLIDTVESDNEMVSSSGDGYSVVTDDESLLDSDGILVHSKITLYQEVMAIGYESFCETGVHKMPQIGISLVLTDSVTGKAVGWDNNTEYNSNYVLCRGTWRGLVSGRTYDASAMGFVTPPPGWQSHGPAWAFASIKTK